MSLLMTSYSLEPGVIDHMSLMITLHLQKPGVCVSDDYIIPIGAWSS